MANWTDIPDSRLEPGAPARSVDALALRDNVIAQTEGAVGAPKTQSAAIQDSAVTTQKIADDAVTSDKLAETSSERNWVNDRISDSGAGAVGTYAMLKYMPSGNGIPTGGVVSSNDLRYAVADGTTGNQPSGTWRCMGLVESTSSRVTLWLRIS